MLVITRKPSESFIIGDNIKVIILEITGDKIKIGIDAPKDVKIIRSEVFETVKSNIEAVSTGNIPNLSILQQVVKK